MEVILAFVVPTAGFGLFALLAVWLGAESRPWFDERPVFDERPNWPAIARRLPDDDEDAPEDDDDDDPGTPERAAPRVRPAPVRAGA